MRASYKDRRVLVNHWTEDTGNKKPGAIKGATNAAVEEWRQVVEHVFRKHNEALLIFLRVRLSSEQEARDVAQEVYVKLLQLEKPQEINVIRAYLFRTAANMAIDYRRRQSTRHKVADELVVMDEQAMPGQERVLAARQELEAVKNAVASLPPKCRQAFILSRNGWANPRIAKYMNVTSRSIRNYISTALDHIEERLEALHAFKGAGHDR